MFLRDIQAKSGMVGNYDIIVAEPPTNTDSSVFIQG